MLRGRLRRPGKGFRRRKVIAAGLAVAVLLAAVGWWLLRPEKPSRVTGAKPPSLVFPAVKPAPKARSGPERRPPRRRKRELPPPPRIEIPAVGVAAHVIDLGLTRDRRLEVPKSFSVAGWWKGGPIPGDRGAAVVVGHVASKAGPGVFHRLHQLRAGAEIRYVARDGEVSRFVAQRTEEHAKARFPTRRVYGRTPIPTLRLVTCSGRFNTATGHYENNLIVFARAASPPARS